MTLRGRNLLSNLFTSSRSSLTCTYKCGNACFGNCDNPSSNPYFGDQFSRRTALRAGGLTVVTVGGSAALAACSNPEERAEMGASESAGTTTAEVELTSAEGMHFDAVQPNTEDKVVIPDGYEQSVLIAWGDPLFKDAPEFDVHNQTAAAAEKQFGFNNDFAGLLKHPDDPNRLVYVCSHEYTTEPMMFPDYDPDNPTEEQVKIGWAGHGHSILEVSKVGDTGELKREFGPLNRRITATTPFRLVGPAAGDKLVQTDADPSGKEVKGTLNNCSGGITPWQTMLSGEENFDQYFRGKAKDKKAQASLERFGIEEEESERKWERFDDRFDVAKTPNEPNRFGWIVEINPLDPDSTPIKHTALGRFKHEAGNIHIADDGTVVCYSGDDSRFEYIYKFISTKKYIEGDLEHNLSILDHGTLYVAKMEGNSPEEEIDGSGVLPEDGLFDGSGTWVKLLTSDTENNKFESHVDGFSAAEVAVFTREAADKVGATKMDRPEDIEVHPDTAKVYVALTNNSYRGATGEDAEKNKEEPMEWAPIKENKNGMVMEIEDDHAGEKFSWNLFIVCGDPREANTYFGGFDKEKVSPISCPDNLAFDNHGNMWISTDGNALDSNDGLYAVTTEGETRGELKCFLTVPAGAETCGPIVTDERVMVNVQHPGEADDATFDAPTSHWPDGGNSTPRPAVAVVWKKDGNIGVEA
ncbi:Putative phosphatase [Corynebacterium camporealensis]|uniref:Putative phosphatase n=1 Tax=Corynebacterium camporealensis TaxID=161896 RepID=A0A0F6TBZ7_9CORY|nr:PhoX family phosphatase [Corynebacterium camporealensis]AKE39934.1 putative phosphatase [Corynebacterium camporealensis]AVH89031.1 Putative phosphatase [Corynebacterium camporealensis]